MCVRSQLGAAYISATTGAVVTALGLKSLAKVFVVARVNCRKIKLYLCSYFVLAAASNPLPFFAASAADCQPLRPLRCCRCC